jgi:hypothetical protein
MLALFFLQASCQLMTAYLIAFQGLVIGWRKPCLPFIAFLSLQGLCQPMTSPIRIKSCSHWHELAVSCKCSASGYTLAKSMTGARLALFCKPCARRAFCPPLSFGGGRREGEGGGGGSGRGGGGCGEHHFFLCLNSHGACGLLSCHRPSLLSLASLSASLYSDA